MMSHEDDFAFDAAWIDKRFPPREPATVAYLQIQRIEPQACPSSRLSPWTAETIRARRVSFVRETEAIIRLANGRVITAGGSVVLASWPRDYASRTAAQHVLRAAQQIVGVLSRNEQLHVACELLPDSLQLKDVSQHFRSLSGVRPSAPSHINIGPKLRAATAQHPTNIDTDAGQSREPEFLSTHATHGARQISQQLAGETAQPLLVIGPPGSDKHHVVRHCISAAERCGSRVLHLSLDNFDDDQPGQLTRALAFAFLRATASGTAAKRARMQDGSGPSAKGHDALVHTAASDLSDGETARHKLRRVVGAIIKWSESNRLLVVLDNSWRAGGRCAKVLWQFVRRVAPCQGVAVIVIARSETDAAQCAQASSALRLEPFVLSRNHPTRPSGIHRPISAPSCTNVARTTEKDALAATQWLMESLGCLAPFARVASAFSERVPIAELAVALEMPPARVRSALAQLVGHGMLIPMDQQSCETYQFCSEALRYTAYSTLSQRAKHDLHAAIRRQIENAQAALNTPATLSDLAWHAALSGDKAAAVGLLLQAGRAAEDNHHTHTAVAHYRQAWQLTSRQGRSNRIGERIMLLHAMACQKTILVGPGHRSVRSSLEWCLARLTERHERATDTPPANSTRETDVLVDLHLSCCLSGDTSRAQTVADLLSTRAFGANSSPQNRALALRAKAYNAIRAGDLNTAQDHIDFALDQCNRSTAPRTDRDPLHATLFTLAAEVATLRDHQSGAAALRKRALQTAAAIGDPSMQATVLCELGTQVAWARQDADVGAYAHAAKSIAQHQGYTYQACLAELLLGFVAVTVDAQRGLSIVDHVIPELQKLNARHHLPLARYLAARAAAAANLPDRARSEIALAQAEAEAFGALTHLDEVRRCAEEISHAGPGAITIRHSQQRPTDKAADAPTLRPVWSAQTAGDRAGGRDDRAKTRSEAARRETLTSASASEQVRLRTAPRRRLRQLPAPLGRPADGIVARPRHRSGSHAADCCNKHQPRK